MHQILLLALVLTPEDWRFEVAQPSVFTVEIVSPVDPVSSDEPVRVGHYAVMFTASWCGPCNEWKNQGNVQRMRDFGCPITLVDDEKVKANPQWGVRSYPTFRIYSRATRKPVAEWIGYTSPSTMAAEAKRLDEMEQQSRKVQPVLNPSIYGLKGTSHESRATLINHLANDGIHEGRHSLNELNAMSDDELNELHKRDHGWK